MAVVAIPMYAEQQPQPQPQSALAIQERAWCRIKTTTTHYTSPATQITPAKVVRLWTDGAWQKMLVNQSSWTKMEEHYVRPHIPGVFVLEGSFSRPVPGPRQGPDANAPSAPSSVAVQTAGWVLVGTAQLFPAIDKTAMLARVIASMHGAMETKIEQYSVPLTIQHLYVRPAIVTPAAGAQMPDAPPPYTTDDFKFKDVEPPLQQGELGQEKENSVDDAPLRRSRRLRRRASEADEPRKRRKTAHKRA